MLCGCAELYSSSNETGNNNRGKTGERQNVYIKNFASSEVVCHQTLPFVKGGTFLVGVYIVTVRMYSQDTSNSCGNFKRDIFDVQ